uniref:Putative secreted protein n=1 Tax=Anopheles darlingi TaxID=43151 RepID=A0A2M4D8K9_ANODA
MVAAELRSPVFSVLIAQFPMQILALAGPYAAPPTNHCPPLSLTRWSLSRSPPEKVVLGHVARITRRSTRPRRRPRRSNL